jgi:hypothetical protein
MMTLADYSTTAFAILNSARIVAYVPQLWRVYRDQNGAAAVSIVTWLLFAAANAATVSYAWFAAADGLVALVFSMNTLGCLAVAALTAGKRLKAMAGLPPRRTTRPLRLVDRPGLRDASRARP